MLYSVDKIREIIEKARLTEEEIDTTIESCYGWDAVEIIPTERGERTRKLKERQAMLQAQLDKILERFPSENKRGK